MTCPWTDEEILILKEQYPKIGSNIPTLSNRSRCAIIHKAMKLGIKANRHRGHKNWKWNDEEIAILKEKYPAHGTNIDLPNHNQSAILNKARRLGIKKVVQSSILDSETEQVVLGSLFGDGSLIILKNGKNALFREMHSSKQKEYLLWKKDKLSIFCPQFNQRSTYDNRTKKVYHSVYFHTKVDECLTKLHNDFYLSNRMLDYLEKLSPLGLAIWYMDDGGYRTDRRQAYLSLGGYTKIEQTKIKKYFEMKWNLNSVLWGHGTNNCQLVFSKECTGSFLQMVKPFVHSSLDYKMGVPICKNKDLEGYV